MDTQLGLLSVQDEYGYIHITLVLILISSPSGAAASSSLHHQGQKEQIGLVFSWTKAVYILYNTYSILIVFLYICLFSLFCIF